MPQMAPLSWILLYIIFSLTLILFSSINFFNYNPSCFKDTSLKSISIKALNWKW
uniref:ATP synthase complex subunit 8 n=1 Tax=Choroterpes yixingensis TaxID=2861365 RepID=A0A8F7CKS1_9INSE|nr:ATP synthase F0 subunit 8 [Choroterpes yixingensis]